MVTQPKNDGTGTNLTVVEGSVSATAVAAPADGGGGGNDNHAARLASNEGEVRLLWLPVEQLELEEQHRYQRPYKEWRAKKIAAEFDPDWYLPLDVSERDGRWYIWDGQHRFRAVKDFLGWTKEVVPCLVIQDDSVEHEAKRFRGTQSKRQQLSALDIYRAGLIEGDAETVAIDRLVRDLGFQVSLTGSHAPKAITAPGSIQAIYRKSGEQGVRTVLGIIRDAFPDDEAGVTGQMMTGVDEFTRFYDGRYDRVRLLRALRDVAAGRIIEEGRVIRMALPSPQADAVARAILNRYNRGLVTHRLPPFKGR